MPAESVPGSVKLSVVVPAFNASAHIGECLDSVFAQEGCPAFEVIVVDDGSIDETAATVARLYPAVHLICQANGGPGSARNVGVNKARGQIIVFIDADDVMLPGRLAFQGQFMLENPRFALTFGNQKHQHYPSLDYNRKLGICAPADFVEIKNAYARLLVEGNFVANVACAVRKDYYQEIGGQTSRFYVGEDYAMCCSLARNWPVAASNRFLTWYRQGHGGNLMASSHTYAGPVLVLKDQLLGYRDRLSPGEYEKSFWRWCGLANMYLRWIWIERGRDAVLMQIIHLRPLIPRRMAVRWRFISLFPSSLGRIMRQLKRIGESILAREV